MDCDHGKLVATIGFLLSPLLLYFTSKKMHLTSAHPARTIAEVVPELRKITPTLHATLHSQKAVCGVGTVGHHTTKPGAIICLHLVPWPLHLYICTLLYLATLYQCT